jgi:hypothetical protein
LIITQEENCWELARIEGDGCRHSARQMSPLIAVRNTQWINKV